MVRVALAQIECEVGNKKQNLEHMEEFIEKATGKKADLIVFPELALTGYLCRDLIYELAEPIPTGPSTERIIELAKKHEVYIVFGMPERSEKIPSVIYNSSVFVGPEGFIGRYRKMFLPTHSVFEEKRYFRPGFEANVFRTEIGRIGLMICYDVYFPEVARLLSFKGAQMIVCISASPAVRRTYFEILLSARAVENCVFVSYVNLVGLENGLQFWGGSRLISPNGDLIAKAKYYEEDLVVAEVDYGEAARAGIFVPTLRDVRPELYDSLKNESEKI